MKVKRVSMDNDFEDKLLRIQDENMVLKKQVHEANNDIKLLTTRLHRLLDIKKQTLEKGENKNLVNLDDMVFNLKLKMSQLESENVKLHQRSLVLQTKLDAIRRRRQYKPMYSSVPSRTDSGIDWVTFNSASKAKMSTKSDIDNGLFICPNKTMDDSQIVDAGIGVHKQANIESHQYHDSLLGESSFRNNAKADLSLQMLKETQDEIGRLQEIIILQQHYIDSLSDSHQLRGKSASNKIKSKEKSNHKSQKKALDSVGLTIEAPANNDGQIDESSSDYHKLSQVFKTSDGSGIDLENMLTTKTIPDEIIGHIDKLSKEVSESQNIIKSLRSQLVNNNLATIKITEMKQKLDNLTLENEILQKSLQNCIGTCISDLEKEFNDDYSGDNNNPKAIESNSIHKELAHLQDKLKKLVIENAKQAQSLEEKNQLIDLLQVKYNNLKDVYDLMISSNIKSSLVKPNSLLTTSTNSTSATLARSWLKSDSIDSSQNVEDEGINSTSQSNEDHNKKVAILDSLGHVREMVECVRSELESTDNK
uniref:Uncharacterized protein n=1 Tax=Tetranychus urticae TaxID=32264 RepID=T1KY68_TETUR